MEEIYPILQTCPLFDGIDPKDLPGMLGCLGARKLQVKKGKAIFREGDAAVFVGIVLTGAVQILRGE